VQDGVFFTRPDALPRTRIVYQQTPPPMQAGELLNSPPKPLPTFDDS
jgi:hypothetical protein